MSVLDLFKEISCLYCRRAFSGIPENDFIDGKCPLCQKESTALVVRNKPVYKPVNMIVERQVPFYSKVKIYTREEIVGYCSKKGLLVARSIVHVQRRKY